MYEGQNPESDLGTIALRVTHWNFKVAGQYPDTSRQPSGNAEGRNRHRLVFLQR